MNRFVQRMNEVERDLTAPLRAAEGCGDADPGRPLRAACRRSCSASATSGTNSCRANSCSPAAAWTRSTASCRWRNPLDPHAEANLMKHLQRASAAKARAFALAAIRETFEETGLLLGRADERSSQGSAGTVERIRRGENPARSQRAAFHRPRHHAARPAAALRRALLHRWTRAPSRIASRASPAPTPNWSNWSGCRSTDAKQLDMPAVTGVMLEELDARIADGFGHDLPVPFYRMPRGRFKREML